MKKLYILLLIMMIPLSGCSLPWATKEKPTPASSSEQQSSFQYTEVLTVNDVTTALKAAGLQLIETQINPADYQFDDINPVIYSLKQSDHIFLLYDYKSINQRKEAEWTGDYYFSYLGSRVIPQKENWFSLTFTARNFVIIAMVDIEKFQQNYSAYNQLIEALKKALFNLNNVQQMVFVDKSRNFDGRLKVEYYQHWYKDDQDRIGIDQYSYGQWQVKYLGAEPESIHNIYYKYSTPSGGCSGNDSGTHLFKKIGQEYYLRLGNTRSNNIPNKDTVYTLTIKLNGQQETLHLKAVQQFLPIATNDYSEATFQRCLKLCRDMI